MVVLRRPLLAGNVRWDALFSGCDEATPCQGIVTKFHGGEGDDRCSCGKLEFANAPEVVGGGKGYSIV